jgi:hypothetical protein
VPYKTTIIKPYIEGGFGYSPITLKNQGSTADSKIITIAVSAGWKAVFRGGFFLEPYVGYRRSTGKLNLPQGVDSFNYDLSGFAYGFGLGWAF